MKQADSPILRRGYTLMPKGEHVLVIRPDKSRTKVINCRLTEQTADRIISKAGKPVEYR
jgi:hypothetical protein